MKVGEFIEQLENVGDDGEIIIEVVEPDGEFDGYPISTIRIMESGNVIISVLT